MPRRSSCELGYCTGVQDSIWQRPAASHQPFLHHPSCGSSQGLRLTGLRMTCETLQRARSSRESRPCMSSSGQRNYCHSMIAPSLRRVNLHGLLTSVSAHQCPDCYISPGNVPLKRCILISHPPCSSPEAVRVTSSHHEPLQKADVRRIGIVRPRSHYGLAHGRHASDAYI